MKQHINLLPPDAQSQIKLARVNSQFLSFSIWLVLSLVIMAVLLFAARIFLNVELKDGMDRIVSESKTLNKLREEGIREGIESYNINLANFNIILKNHEKWSPVLIELSSIVPPDVRLDGLVINRIDNKVEIRGHAGNRKSVLKLRENILNSKYFTNVNFPLKNLEKPSDLSWKYSFYIRPEVLK